MSDSLRTDRVGPLDVRSIVDRDAKIEQLLLDGLDHYFGAQYEQAINVWTRALFLDRSHARARAYIERARSALAERQREWEELLQNGLAALERGEIDEAKRVIQTAIERGAPSDEARTVLERVNRLGVPAVDPLARESVTARQSTPPVRAGARSSRWGWLTAVGVVVAMVLGIYAAIRSDRIDWRSLLMFEDVPARGGSALLMRDSELPLPRRGQIALARARALAVEGHLRDALVVLDLVRPTDPQRPEADRLRSDIQRELLAVAPSLPSGTRDARNGNAP